MNIRVPVLITFTLIIVAVVFAWLGFANAGNSRVAPAVVSGFLFASAFFFALLVAHGIRQKGWQRFIGVLAIEAMLFTLVMAVVYYQVLSKVQMPF